MAESKGADKLDDNEFDTDHSDRWADSTSSRERTPFYGDIDTYHRTEPYEGSLPSDISGNLSISEQENLNNPGSIGDESPRSSFSYDSSSASVHTHYTIHWYPNSSEEFTIPPCIEECENLNSGVGGEPNDPSGPSGTSNPSDDGNNLGTIQLRNPWPTRGTGNCKSLSTLETSTNYSAYGKNRHILVDTYTLDENKDNKELYKGESYTKHPDLYYTFSKVEIEKINEGWEAGTLNSIKFNDIVDKKNYSCRE